MGLGDEFKSSGITENTPKSVMLGAGTIHRGLRFVDSYTLLTIEPIDWDTNYTDYYTKSGDTYSAVTGASAPEFATDTYYEKVKAWNFAESLICATSGGSKLSIVPEFYDVPVDGALVKVKGLTAKVGETATLEINPIELTGEILSMAVIADSKTSDTATGYTELTSRATVNEGDYLEYMGYVGKTIDGKPIIIIFDNSLCTSGLELEGKNKEAAVPKFTFECFADLSPEADVLPWHIYYPTPATV